MYVGLDSSIISHVLNFATSKGCKTGGRKVETMIPYTYKIDPN